MFIFILFFTVNIDMLVDSTNNNYIVVNYKYYYKCLYERKEKEKNFFLFKLKVFDITMSTYIS